MGKYEYHLAPAYSIYNSVVITKQKGAHISFLISYYEEKNIIKKLSESFVDYLTFVRSQADCPESFKNRTVISFSYANKAEIYKKINCK